MALSHRAELLARNPETCTGARPLVVDFDIDDLLELAREGLALTNATLACHHFGALRRARVRANDAGIGDVHFGLFDLPPEPRFDRVLLSLPQGREARALIFALAARLLTPDGRMVVVGETRAGIRPARTTLGEFFADVESIDSARRCGLLCADKPNTDALPPDPVGASFRRFEASAGGTTIAVESLPGVFSHGELDEGTQALLESFRQPLPGRILDFGCGAGVIGTWLQRHQEDVHVDMVDASALAVASARRTATDNNLPTDRVWPSDVFSDVPGAYDLIVSNPPFHRGVDTDWTTVERFLSEAGDHLNPGGRLRFVANTHLAYASTLDARFTRWRVVHETDRFLVYEATP
ncbi:MAG TPA: class I SAM-dependent methyltransferase [Phycisphaerae bacterium]|nr:class I SAM-dependent methyltransferase [Phycisphaerae bacterium]